MDLARLYGHFAAAYGTFWLATVLFALVTQTLVTTGALGLLVFPALAGVYAFFRTAAAGDRERAATAGTTDRDRLRLLEDEIRRLQEERQAAPSGGGGDPESPPRHDG